MTTGVMKSRRPEPAEIEYKNMRFLIMDRPSDANIDRFIEELKKCGARDVVRDWQFDDGNPPPSKIVDEWFNLLKTRFKEDPGCCVAVHCVAGLGRAPVLVALALMECGLKYEDAVELIRTKRRGAINAKQLSFLEHYKPRSRLKVKGNGHKQCSVIWCRNDLTVKPI
ncbi:TP4A2-like protein [Mya arenaria]|uniref:TP4A2-like protein n=1 Tax=Mya arenaria TaxID=6604 RepID=A0ABY7F6J3_MYAAR|nr:TP4A2-like protein [Mya arenaria]